jgi:hypothetical protein
LALGEKAPGIYRKGGGVVLRHLLDVVLKRTNREGQKERRIERRMDRKIKHMNTIRVYP